MTPLEPRNEGWEGDFTGNVSSVGLIATIKGLWQTRARTWLSYQVGKEIFAFKYFIIALMVLSQSYTDLPEVQSNQK